MLDKLDGYCDELKLCPIYANENGLNFKCTIKGKMFGLLRNKNQVTITVYDDLIFNSFVAVLQSKYKTLLTIRRNVELIGDTRPYNYIQFNCAKESKIKEILARFESVYTDILMEKEG